jgi:hypothetical protein
VSAIETTDAEDTIRNGARELAREKGTPVLAYVGPIHMGAILPLLDQVEHASGDELHVLLSSHGGDLEAAAMIAGILGRRYGRLVVHVPFCARSAATLLCLAADELVIGELGALGPLDGQRVDGVPTDHPGASQLDLIKGLEQVRGESLSVFETALQMVARETPLDAADAASTAAELAGCLLGRLYGALDLVQIGSFARGLDTGSAFAERVLKRSRPDVWAAAGPQIVERLVRGYPAHGFPLDLEEIVDLGVPARRPDGPEVSILARVARALLGCQENAQLIELITPAAAAESAAPAAEGSALGDHA